MQINKKRNERIKFTNIDDLKKVLKEEGYSLDLSNEEVFINSVSKAFNIDSSISKEVYETLAKKNITYKVKSINEFIDYIKNNIIFENEHNKLCKKINSIKKLRIDRIEYERIASNQDDVDYILKEIEEIKKTVSSKIDNEGKLKLQGLKVEIDSNYVYAKDIELLKRMLICNNDNFNEKYNELTQTKTVFIEIPPMINYGYVKAVKGSVEYYQHIKSYIPRMNRLIKNLDKYIVKEDEWGTFKINQSSTIQDSVNMAIALFDNKVFRAVSGKNDIENSCKLVPLGEEVFKSCKVNKLGKLGIGYNRVNDSEKKIIEEVCKQIESNELSDSGEFILYSKWEPCPSCYYIISQFCKKYPKINVKVKYGEKYGELNRGD